MFNEPASGVPRTGPKAKVFNLVYGEQCTKEMKNRLEKLGDFEVIEASNDDIIPVNDLDSESQKMVIFDDYVCDKNQKPLIDYFIRGRHKNCCVIYLSQSYYKTPKDIRLNCSHFCIY